MLRRRDDRLADPARSIEELPGADGDAELTAFVAESRGGAPDVTNVLLVGERGDARAGSRCDRFSHAI